MRFELLRTKGDVSKVSASDPLGHRALLTCLAVLYDIYIKMGLKPASRVMNASQKLHIRTSSFTFAMHIGTNLDQDLSADVVFLFLEVYSSSCQQCR